MIKQNGFTRLRIILLFPHFNTLEQSSGLRSWQIGRHLARQGHEVTVLAPGVDISTGKLFPEMRGRLYASSATEGLRLIRCRMLQNFRRSVLHRLSAEAIFALLTAIRAVAIRRLDLVVTAYPPAVLPLLGLAVAKLRNVPIVFEMRDLMAGALEATGYADKLPFLVKAAKWVEGFVARRSDHIISVSPGLKKALVATGIPGDKISVSENGYEPEVFAETRPSFDPRLEFGWGRRFVAIYAGGLTQSYDIPTLLRCAVRLREQKDILFVIIGEGERKADYIELCRRRGLENCQFIEAQPRRHIASILSRANAGVHLFPNHPLWAYVLGNKPFDYLGSGLPIVFAGIGDTAELVRRADAGIVVPPEDDEEFARALLFLKANPEKARAMGDRGREFVKRHYNRNDLLAGFEEILCSVASSG